MSLFKAAVCVIGAVPLIWIGAMIIALAIITSDTAFVVYMVMAALPLFIGISLLFNGAEEMNKYWITTKTRSASAPS
jgi:hypothetical protein